MNAEEARKKASANAKIEAQEVLVLIAEAVKRADTQISVLSVSIPGGVIEWLKENGYTIEESGFAPRITKISW